MAEKPKILGKKVVAESRLFSIEGLDLEFSNGERRQYERVVGKAAGAVMVVPLLDDETILLVREYSAGMEEYTLGFPKGAVESEESLLDTANRELQEETGYAARQLRRLGQFSVSPGYMTALMQLVLAEDLYPSSLEGDEPEPIEVVKWKLSEIDQLLQHPEFYEARSVAALLMVDRLRNE